MTLCDGHKFLIGPTNVDDCQGTQRTIGNINWFLRFNPNRKSVNFKMGCCTMTTLTLNNLPYKFIPAHLTWYSTTQSPNIPNFPPCISEQTTICANPDKFRIRVKSLWWQNPKALAPCAALGLPCPPTPFSPPCWVTCCFLRGFFFLLFEEQFSQLEKRCRLLIIARRSASAGKARYFKFRKQDNRI